MVLSKAWGMGRVFTAGLSTTAKASGSSTALGPVLWFQSPTAKSTTQEYSSGTVLHRERSSSSSSPFPLASLNITSPTRFSTEDWKATSEQHRGHYQTMLKRCEKHPSSSSWTQAETAVSFMNKNTDHKANLHCPYHALAFHWMEPLLQPEILSEWFGCNPGRRQLLVLCPPPPPGHPTAGACSTYIFAQVVSSQWMRQAWPTPTCLRHVLVRALQHTSAPSQNMTAAGPRTPASPGTSAQPSCLQPEALLPPQRPRREHPGCLPHQFATFELAHFHALYATRGCKMKFRLWL